MQSREAPDAGDASGRRAVAVPLAFKGLVACLLLVLYSGLMAAYVLAQRQVLADQRSAMEQLQALEESLKRAGLAVSNAVLAMRQAAPDESPADVARESAPYALEAAAQALGGWEGKLPGLVARIAAARKHLVALAEGPSRANLLSLREALDQVAREIERERAAAGERRIARSREYREQSDAVALQALALGLGGLLVFGGVTAAFFVRLAADLRLLGRRANEVVSGYRGEPLEVTRRDEVGQLARDVNHMASTLAARERDLALARERRAHREKMAALGAMSRNLLHEVGNPLAVIAGAVQEADARLDAPSRHALQADELLRQTQRIAEITRQIADFAGPRADAPDIVDAREMLGAVCDFMRFDPRLRGARIEAHVPEHLPPLLVVPDELNEVFMGLLQPGAGEAGRGLAGLRVEAIAVGSEVSIRATGSALWENPARRERTRQLVEGMGGRLAADAGEVRITLPAALSLKS